MIGAWVFRGDLNRILFAREPAAPVLTEDFNQGDAPSAGVTDVQGLSRCGDGWCLAPSATGHLVYRFSAPRANPFVVLWWYLPPGGHNRVLVSEDGGLTYRPVLQDTTLTSAPVDLGIRGRRPSPVFVRFEVENPSPNLVLALDKLTVMDGEGGVASMDARVLHVFAMLLCFGLAAVLLSRDWRLAATTALIIAVGGTLRYRAVTLLALVPLEPDAEGYLRFAHLMVPFSDTGFYSARFGEREPGFIFFTWLWGRAFVLSEVGFRMQGAVLSTASLWAIMRLGRSLFGRVAGQGIGVVVALSTVLVTEAPRGLRLEFELLLCMGYFWAAFVREWSSLRPMVVVLTALGAAMTLTRATYLPVVVALNALAFLRVRPLSLVRWAAAAGVAALGVILLMAPHRHSMYRLRGDPFWDTARYARWNANWEFVGQPGFPTAEQLQASGYVGPPLSYGEYMFGMHTPAELLVGTTRGYGKLFVMMRACPVKLEVGNGVCRVPLIDQVFVVLAGIGMIACAVVARYRWIPIAFLIIEFPVAFLYDRRLVELYRHSYTAYPLVLFAATYALVLAGQALRRWTRPAAHTPA
ncbi:hypothetical protein TBR22_A39140 [Luteitalea sp. TBR-22]|nr:hypothetical protein TBR22_A39140 [Luteitalea sp. TBR-22]